jgi:hypothetical protein
MKQLGINIYDASGQFIGITAVAQQLHDTLGPLDAAQRNAALGTLFGARAVRGATVLYQQGAEGLQDWIDKSSQSGAAAETAAKKLDNLSGDLHKLLGSLQAVAISSSGGATAGLRFLAQGAEKALNAFLDLPKPIGETATVLLGVGAAALLATSGLLKAKTTITGAMDALRGIGPLGEKAAGILGTLGKWGGVAGVAAVGIFAAFEGLKAWANWLDKKTAPIHLDLEELTNDLKRFAQTGIAAGQMGKTFGADLNKLAYDIGSVNATALRLASAPPAKPVQRAGRQGATYIPDELSAAERRTFAQQKAQIADLDKSLADLATNGGAPQAKMAFDKITSALVAQGIPLEQVTASFGQYNKAASNAAAATAPVAQGFGDIAANADLMAKGMQDAVDHGLTLLDVFKQLNGAALSDAAATDAMHTAFLDAQDAVAKNGKTLDEHTAKGIANRKVLEDIATTTGEATAARFTDTGSLEQANKVYEEGRQKFIAVAIQMGATKQQAQALADQWLKMPPIVSTQVLALGLDPALATVSSYAWALDRLDGRVVTSYIVTNTQTGQQQHIVHGGAQFQRWGGVVEHAQAGLINAGVYAARSRPVYAFAEPATRGEAFIPRSGDVTRSRAIADYVVTNWLGGQTSWNNGSGGASTGTGSSIALDITIRDDDGRVLGKLRKAVNSRGGNVQFAVMGRP